MATPVRSSVLLRTFSIMRELVCIMRYYACVLVCTYYARNYAGIMCASLHVRSHSSIIITCCIMQYNYIHNSGHVCHTHIKCYANRKTYRFSSKRHRGYYIFQHYSNTGLFKGGYYLKCGVYSRKYGKRGRAQPSFKVRAIVYGSSNTRLPNAGH